MRHVLSLAIALIIIQMPANGQPLQDCAQPSATHSFQVGDVKTTLGHGGALWQGEYLAPYQAGLPSVSTAYTAGLWIGALDPAGNLKLAANTYSAFTGEGGDFYPGPLTPFSLSPGTPPAGITNAATCAAFDRHWPVNRADIEAFRADYQLDGQVDGDYSDIFAWPGRGNMHSVEYNGFVLPDQPLAPFVDLNQDGAYQPENGEYPDVPGDRAVWWVINDAGNIHFQSDGDKLQIEVHLLAYGFEVSDPQIRTTTFYRLTLINRALEDATNIHTGLFLDFDLGCPTDDRLGCVPADDLAYVYNRDAVDGDPGCACADNINTYCESPPIFAVKFLRTPFSGAGEPLGMTSFMYFNNPEVGSPPPETTGPLPADPYLAARYYLLLRGRWKDSTPLQAAGDGYDEGAVPETTFAFPDPPGDPNGWSLCTAGLPDYDRRALMSTGPFFLQPFQSAVLEFAALFVPQVPHPCPDLAPLAEACDAVRGFYGDLVPARDVFLEKKPELRLFPNPASGQCTFLLPDENDGIRQLRIFDTAGRPAGVWEGGLASGIHITTDRLPAGIYFYRLLDRQGRVYTGKLTVAP